ncbi:hypothetical protein KA405_05305 [Patescibacteria group bacterium]|nr:hypothetical protein [Patescibacteria group bacterium]
MKDIPEELEYCVSFLQKEYKSACKKQLLSPEELEAYKNYIDICCL